MVHTPPKAENESGRGTQQPTPSELERFRLFVTESNRIEGIYRSPTNAELQAHLDLLRCSDLLVEDIERFVAVVAPGKPLRRKAGMNVYVGNHVPIPGGVAVPEALGSLLLLVNSGAKAASARIAKIPAEISAWIGRAWLPHPSPKE